MTPNPWLLAALIVTTISAAVWAWLAEPWLDEHTRPTRDARDRVVATVGRGPRTRRGVG